MASYKYAYQGYDEKKMARAVGVSLPISYKQAIEICRYLKNRSLVSAKNAVNDVLAMKKAVPYKRFNMDVGHKPGIAAGRYPQKASREILKLINVAEANANVKGLSNLHIKHMSANRAPAGPRAGRIPGEAKRAHVEIVIEEKQEEKKAERKSKENKND